MSAVTVAAGGPAVVKSAAERLRVLIDFDALMRPHELLVKVIGLDPAGALIELSRCNAGRFVQLDIGIDADGLARERCIGMTVQTTQGTVAGALVVQVTA